MSVVLGRGLGEELITRPEESCRLWCVVVCDLETSLMRRPWPTGACRAKNKQASQKLSPPTPYLSIPYQPADISFTKIFPHTDGTVVRKSMKISIFQPENIKGHGHSGDLDVDGRIILKWISSMVSDSWEDPLDFFKA